MLKVCVTPLGYIEFIAKEEYVKGMRYSNLVFSSEIYSSRLFFRDT